MEDSHARRILKRGGDEIEVAPGANHIGIAEVTRQDGVDVSPVSLVSPFALIAFFGECVAGNNEKAGRSKGASQNFHGMILKMAAAAPICPATSGADSPASPASARAAMMAGFKGVRFVLFFDPLVMALRV